MALSGWGLTPGTLEKNVTRSLGGKYGAVGNNPATITDMMRQKYAAGLQAKSAKESFDLARTSEANRQSEATRAFGLESEKFGFTQSQAEKDRADALRQYELQKAEMEGGWSQDDLDRALREQQMLSQEKMTAAQLAQSGQISSAQLAQTGQISAANLAQRMAEAQMTANDRSASLAEKIRAAKELEVLRREQEARAEKERQDALTAERNRLAWDKTKYYDTGSSPSTGNYGGSGYGGGGATTPAPVSSVPFVPDPRTPTPWLR